MWRICFSATNPRGHKRRITSLPMTSSLQRTMSTLSAPRSSCASFCIRFCSASGHKFRHTSLLLTCDLAGINCPTEKPPFGGFSYVVVGACAHLGVCIFLSSPCRGCVPFRKHSRNARSSHSLHFSLFSLLASQKRKICVLCLLPRLGQFLLRETAWVETRALLASVLSLSPWERWHGLP